MRKPRTRKIQKDNPSEQIGLRGGIEVMLKNAFTGETIIHDKGPNVVLYVGRNALMTRALNTVSQVASLVPCVLIGTSPTATSYTHTNLQAYYTFKTAGATSTTQSGGTGVPIWQITASWESTELNVNSFNSIQEFALGFNSVTNSSNINPVLCRYLSGAAINATTSNQLLITYTVSF